MSLNDNHLRQMLSARDLGGLAADAGRERRRDDRGRFEKSLDVAWNATMLAILAICAAIAVMGVLP